MTTSNLTKRQKQAIFALNLARLILRAHELDIYTAIAELYRTPERQAYLAKTGKSLTLRSKHLHGLAADLLIVEASTIILNDDPRYETLGQLWEALGGTWGGRWKALADIYHFELSDKMIENAITHDFKNF